jgi:hypothetical protein
LLADLYVGLRDEIPLVHSISTRFIVGLVEGFFNLVSRAITWPERVTTTRTQ